jgi:hypothetical protein
MKHLANLSNPSKVPQDLLLNKALNSILRGIDGNQSLLDRGKSSNSKDRPCLQKLDPKKC